MQKPNSITLASSELAPNQLVLWNLAFTSRFDGFVVGLADELLVVHEIELVSGVQLSTAHGAGETLEVIDVVLRSPDDLCRRDSLFAAGTLCAVATTTPHTTRCNIHRASKKRPTFTTC